MQDQLRLRQLIQESAQLKQRIAANKKAACDASLHEMSAQIELLSPPKFKATRQLEGHIGKIFGLSWSKDSRRLATVSQDESLIVWDAPSGSKLAHYSYPSTFAMCCALHPMQPHVTTGGLDNNLTCLGISSSGTVEPINVLHGHKGYISGIRYFSPRELLSSSGDGTCALWDIERGARVCSFSGHTSDVACVCPAPDASTFVSGGCDGRAIIWDVRNARPMREYIGHRSDINSVDFFPTGLSFATGGDDGMCSLFDIRADRQLVALLMPAAPRIVNSVSFSHNGRVLFAAYNDAHVRAWDILKGKVVWEEQAHESNTPAVAVNSSGTAVATCGWDGLVKVWA